MYCICIKNNEMLFKRIVSRDFVVCFLVSFARSEVPTHTECVRLLLKLHFCFELFDFASRRSESTL
jgi:hypothetical protein